MLSNLNRTERCLLKWKIRKYSNFQETVPHLYIRNNNSKILLKQNIHLYNVNRQRYLSCKSFFSSQFVIEALVIKK